MLYVITIGRASVDLCGSQIGGQLENLSSFAKYLGGSSANTAVGAARLDLKSALITSVSNEHMKRFLIDQLEREAFGTSGVKIDQKRLTALVILGIGKKNLPTDFLPGKLRGHGPDQFGH